MNGKLPSISQLNTRFESGCSGGGGQLLTAAQDLLSYLPGYLTTADADALQAGLTSSMVWTREQIHMYGRSIPVPRLVAWCGDSGLDYRYSGLPHLAEGWPDSLRAVRDEIEQRLDCRFNFALLNRYRDGSEYMGWHRDDEPGVGTTVASISLGASRRFLLRQRGETRSTRLDLDHGSLLVFAGSQPHSLPRCKNAAERLNITFRTIRQNGSC